jgi:DNA-binding transcriptional LysR family regulator
VHIGDAQEVLHDLEANRYDLGVVTLPASGRSFEVETICDDALLAVTTNGAMASAAVIDPAFLAEKNLLLYEGGNTREIVDRWFATAGIQPKPVMEFGSVEAIKELVRAGLGWSILPAMAVKSEGLDTRPLTPGLQRSLGMVVRRDKHLSRGLREIMQSLRNL